MIIKDYTKEQITRLIDIIKDCAYENQFSICMKENRQENILFIEEFNINENKLIKILTDLKEEDFCYGLKDMADGTKETDYYIFCPNLQLHNIKGNKENVDVYLRVNIIESVESNLRLLLSIHKRNKPISYIFR